MQCDINAMKSRCSDTVIGLKTEFECKLIQDRCIGLKRKAISKICNENSYKRASRQSVSLNGQGQQGGVNNPNNSATTLSSVSILSAVGLGLLSLLL